MNWWRIVCQMKALLYFLEAIARHVLPTFWWIPKVITLPLCIDVEEVLQRVLRVEAVEEPDSKPDPQLL